MKPPVPSATPTWRNDTYDAISLSRPELSASGKRIVIIGAGSGIGRETARAFAAAGASHVALLGRREALLNDTKSQVTAANENTSVSVHAVDITRETSIKDTAASIGKWDVLINAAGYVSDPGPMASADTEEWWKGFEVHHPYSLNLANPTNLTPIQINIKGAFIAIKSFLPTANPSHTAILTLTSGMATAPAKNFVPLSSYMISKLAQVKLMEFLALEQPHIFAATVHPGMVDTDILRKSGGDPSRLPLDTCKLYLPTLLKAIHINVAFCVTGGLLINIALQWNYQRTFWFGFPVQRERS
ncbi:putative NADP(+)-dependent dehydrogenase [Annulohypoxylon maeteangense]|uniref:putative NADP(+)-dependent dehydrogenase n=1 Tax=Annulohypoxylon maeteangense TaxID=1927788 RepID=UPI0020088C7E|nr:putative NADP(+)-dependent dehydrogenase [Annulohypoxylon maeteangense]KAI0886857.1 putative NADP(+)-dependent dehydrogenase [Annulohypoxylon maeteangense]